MGRRVYRTPEESFKARTERRGECLIWVGGRVTAGYGIMTVGKRKQDYAHRYAWERVNGPIPDGMMVDHRYHCDKACVEITHLRLATRSQNNANLRGARRHNKSTGVRNVYTNGKGYMVNVAGRYIGQFATVVKAEEAAEEARSEIFGDFKGQGR